MGSQDYPLDHDRYASLSVHGLVHALGVVPDVEAEEEVVPVQPMGFPGNLTLLPTHPHGNLKNCLSLRWLRHFGVLVAHLRQRLPPLDPRPALSHRSLRGCEPLALHVPLAWAHGA